MADIKKVFLAARRSGDKLTASPREHIARAERILARGRLSELLYAALELRLALERITNFELVLAESASNRMLKEYSASKKVTSLRKLAPESELTHNVEIRHAVTGEWSKIGEYRPLDRARASEINGRLGDLLHAKEGLKLGIPDREPWYRETYLFLCETAEFLSESYEGNTQFFSYEGLDHIRMVPRW